MKKCLYLGLIALLLNSCTLLFPGSKVVPEETVKLGITSKTNDKQEYEEFFLKLDGQVYSWKIDEPDKPTVKRIDVTKGQHEYELTVKSSITTSKGKDLIMGTSSGTLTVLNSKDLKLVWDKKLEGNHYKISLR